MSWPKDALAVRWDKRTKDFLLRWPPGTSKADAHLMHSILFTDRFGSGPGLLPPLIEELERRGYDPATLRFSIKKKQATGNEVPTKGN